MPADRRGCATGRGSHRTAAPPSRSATPNVPDRPAVELRLAIAERDGRLVPMQVPLRRVVLAGYTGRDRVQVAAHIHELERLGVTPPERVPMVWDVAPALLTTASRISVRGAETSGEAEFCVVAHD